MRHKDVFAHARALPRMSWSSHNLFNLWMRSFGPKVAESKFAKTSLSLFQQRWIAKRLVRAYHGDHISEKIFRRWYLPMTLPDTRSRKTTVGDDTVSLVKWAKRDDIARHMSHRQQSQDDIALAPVGSLMFKEVERRIDVFIFRCCFASSVYEARRLVLHGNVKLNGKKHINPNTRLAPGDMVSVEPSAMRLLRGPKKTKEPSNDTEGAKEEDVTKDPGIHSGRETDEEGGTNEGDEARHGAQNQPRDQPLTSKPVVLTPFNLPEYATPFIFIPAYVEPSFPTCSAIYLRHPTARPGYSEIPTPYEADGEVIRLAWEWYAKRRPRVRGRSRLASMPEDNEMKRGR